MFQGTFHILTFGCQMNVNDSLWLSRALQRRGFVESTLDEAGIVILNTCSVRDKPEQKVYTTLGRIRHVTRHIPNAFVVVAGCVAQQIGSGFFSRFPQVRLVVGSDGLATAPDAIERLCREPGLRLDLTDFSETYPERDPALSETSPVDPVGYVNIMQGCDNFCSYCIVPFTRGRQKSRAAAAVLAECQSLLQAGVREITLLGQNVNAYGLDKRNRMQGDTSFAALLRQVSELCSGSERERLPRLRFVTPHPKDFSEETVSLFADLPNLCPRLHLPLQAGSNAVLSRMGRRYTLERYLDLVRQLREAQPDLALSTDLIVGFPGETESQFQETLDALDAANFMSSFSFCYSDRPGTAASRLGGKIALEEKAERLARLQARQDMLSERWLQSRIGLNTQLLLESPSRRQEQEDPTMESWQGRDPWGDTVNIGLLRGVGKAGLLLPVRLVAAKRHSLLAERLPKEGGQ